MSNYILFSYYRIPILDSDSTIKYYPMDYLLIESVLMINLTLPFISSEIPPKDS